jgi:hypothetical protein
MSQRAQRPFNLKTKSFQKNVATRPADAYTNAGANMLFVESPESLEFKLASGIVQLKCLTLATDCCQIGIFYTTRSLLLKPA